MINSQLLSLRIKNYRSFYSEQVVEFGEDEASAVTAIYGANGSGKSNIAQALQFVQGFIRNSTRADIRNLPHDPFLLRKGSEKEDSFFEVKIIQKGRRFQYAFSLNSERVSLEELKEFSGKTTKAKTIFSRKNGKLNPSADKFGFGKRLTEATRPGSLLLTKARENNNEYANIIFEWLDSFNVLRGMQNEVIDWSLFNMKIDNHLRESVTTLLKEADLWIRGFNIENVTIPREVIDGLPIKDEVKAQMFVGGGQATAVRTVHALRDADYKIVGEQTFDLVGQESTGTMRFFEIAAPLVNTLEKGKVLYIDEFESHLHPDISRFIVHMFMSKANKNKAQLIVNTHDTSLMSKDGLLGRENIIFVEKSFREESIISPLASKSVRAGESFEKRYREGLYGAKPQIEERE